ncbi:dcc family protein at1g52590 chloroplastic [Phtheirospermum japonicum]|uniref:Dcc family protein at1g52590 chloroplastic n=1 Tax=Phtheirospermum japonicum TaxID=374723 RepID=A0A830DGY2_9LAMI|nr:dcc family protein at1g52590 chloroplastic [Phtheirospermum japonicum]
MGGVKFVRENDRQRNIRFEALQSEAGKKLLQRSGRAPDDISSVVLVEKDRFVRDFVYENIADNRYNLFGRTILVKYRVCVLYHNWEDEQVAYVLKATY